MELFEALATSGPAQWLRFSRWGYAAVNTGHVFGLALLVGSIVALDLRLLGFWRDVPHRPLARVLLPVAVAGLFIALPTGAFLFVSRAPEYPAEPVFWLKVALIGVGLGQAAALHIGPGMERATRARLRVAGAVSVLAWAGALIAGRMIAFTAD